VISPAVLHNKGSLLLCEASVCAPWHKTPQSTKKAPNFGELRVCELPRIPQKAKFAEYLSLLKNPSAQSESKFSSPTIATWIGCKLLNGHPSRATFNLR
jgi:hypothetical protein